MTELELASDVVNTTRYSSDILEEIFGKFECEIIAAKVIAEKVLKIGGTSSTTFRGKTITNFESNHCFELHILYCHHDEEAVVRAKLLLSDSILQNIHFSDLVIKWYLAPSKFLMNQAIGVIRSQKCRSALERCHRDYLQVCRLGFHGSASLDHSSDTSSFRSENSSRIVSKSKKNASNKQEATDGSVSLKSTASSEFGSDSEDEEDER